MDSSTSNETLKRGITFLPEKNVGSDLTTNLSRNSSEYGHRYLTESQHRIITGTLILQSTLGVVLNIITILAISFGKKTGKKVKMQLINLAVADCLMALFVVPGYTYVDELSLSTNLQCKLFFFTYYALSHAGLICNSVISIERAFIVLFPLQEKFYRKVHRIYVIMFIWLCTTLPEIEELLYQELITGYVNGNSYITCARTDGAQKQILAMLLWCIIPVSVILMSYTAIFLKLFLRRRSSITQNASTKQQASSQQVLIMLAADALLTLFTWLPFNILASFGHTLFKEENFQTYETLEIILYLLMGTNAFSTPVVYLIFSKNFKHDLRTLCKRTLSKSKSIKHQPRGKVKDSEEEATPSSKSTGLSDEVV
ncbi:rhodopsin-like [Watersipora subatra]|uniref:rhodopsin-like n=1 Tax=Watersipora subatra TaxID=2589382 RepID=UPI00355AF8CE